MGLTSPGRPLRSVHATRAGRYLGCRCRCGCSARAGSSRRVGRARLRGGAGL